MPEKTRYPASTASRTSATKTSTTTATMRRLERERQRQRQQRSGSGSTKYDGGRDDRSKASSSRGNPPAQTGQRVVSMGLREQEKHASKMSRENFDLKLRLRLEREKNDKLEKDMRAMTKRLAELENQLSEASADIETLENEQSELYEQLHFQDSVLDNAVTVTQGYDERQAQMEYGAMLARGAIEGTVGVSPFTYKIAGPKDLGSTPSVSPHESTDLIDTTSPPPGNLTHANLLEHAFLNQAECTPPRGHSPARSKSADSERSRKTKDSLGSPALSDISVRDLGSVYGHHNEDGDGEEDDVSSNYSSSSSTNQGRSIQEIMERTTEFNAFFTKHLAQLEEMRIEEKRNWIPGPTVNPLEPPTKDVDTHPQETRNVHEFANENNPTFLPDSANDNLCLSPESEDTNLSLTLRMDGNASRISQMAGGEPLASEARTLTCPNTPTGAGQRSIDGSSSSGIATPRGYFPTYSHASPFVATPSARVGGINRSETEHLLSNTGKGKSPTSLQQRVLTPRTRSLVTDVAQSVVRRLGFGHSFRHKRVPSLISPTVPITAGPSHPTRRQTEPAVLNNYVKVEPSRSASVASSRTSWESLPTTINDNVKERQPQISTPRRRSVETVRKNAKRTAHTTEGMDQLKKEREKAVRRLAKHGRSRTTVDQMKPSWRP